MCKKIAYIIPYFGKFRDDINLWLRSCEYNPTIDWYVVTDDCSNYNHPNNVTFLYTSLKDFKDMVQEKYDFKISLETPYKLCDYKPAFGEIFEDIIKGYDFWGHCDMDLIFGDIRSFITDDILNKYDRIGKWGHSILYRNTYENNHRYRTEIDDLLSYKTVFASRESYFFDELGMLDIYDRLEIETYKDAQIADLHPSYWRFEVISDNKVVREKNKNRIFYWNEGKLISYSIYNSAICADEYMYVHFLRRPMKLFGCDDALKNFLIVPNKIYNINSFTPDEGFIRKSGKNKMSKYWVSLIKRKWKTATPDKVLSYFKGRIRGKYKKIFKNGQ